VSVQAQILNLLKDLQDRLGISYLFITHNISVVEYLAHEVAVMYLGRIVEEAPTERLFAAPAHPYTRGLLGALPPIDGPRRRLSAIPGGVPEPWAMPPGCAFAPRCSMRVPACDGGQPPVASLVPGHQAACLRAAVLPTAAEAVAA
jgi:peptide/nickel transport system ATP-binding protein